MKSEYYLKKKKKMQRFMNTTNEIIHFILQGLVYMCLAAEYYLIRFRWKTKIK